ncbi:hypothetical protein GJW-30_1_01466 [Variibacter gotjawalensis]|uniref:DUF1236 domain-containing protein n=1 Tax=Variibacter gotjawalensis TaxID=1333996 RepID=A0A0S3PSM3_9BRAD|nr:hypothetical protein [Variibacter gotjawalensis]NIK49251.1 hypothetical protein [Variibacter gotjawalensis]RZS51103.1 hypothetical protein EV661_3577 [Variibacter gotjawalensis]BAT58938.1 hypothetical protein GJW-30_1_01466 [Variibacter gotjawalensis]
MSEDRKFDLSRRTALILVVISPSLAWAQSATPDAEGDLRLTPAQRDLIYSSISNQKHVSTATPPTWQPKIGDTVPQGVEVIAMPPALTEAIPQVKGYSCAFVGGQVIIIQTEKRTVVELITQKA